MRKPLEQPKIFKERRNKLAELMPGSVLILASLSESLRNGSVHNPFRQDSNLYYLTGFEEPQSIFVFRPGQNPESILFCNPKDPAKEIWDGFRYGPELAQTNFEIEKTYPREQFEAMLPQLLKGSQKLYYRFFRNPEVDVMVKDALISHKLSLGRTGLGLLPIYDADELMGELRVHKSDTEIENHRRACDLSAEAHIELMKYVKPGMTERELHGFFIYQIMRRGAAREGYGGIFASGPNACILHYTFNDQIVKNGDFLLVDAAGEFNYLTSDITRTYPVNGKFTLEQKELYEGVLNVQKTVIACVKVGRPYKELQEVAINELSQLILDLGLMSGRKEDLIQSGEYRKYYPHGIGHFLGMDVHDAGLYIERSGKGRNIEPGMVFTIEPGLYIPPNDPSAPKGFQGLGVRIEDNILVTTNGFEVLTKKCPKEIPEIEAVVGK